MIHCLVTSKVSLNDETRWALYRAAFTMFRERAEKRKFKTGMCEGEIRCDYKYCLLGNIRGTAFSATLETDRGTGNVKFIVNTSDLVSDEDGQWVPVDLGERPPPREMGLHAVASSLPNGVSPQGTGGITMPQHLRFHQKQLL